MKSQCCVNELFSIGRKNNNEYFPPITLLNVQRGKQKDMRNRNFKISAYLTDLVYVYSNQVIDDVELICHNINIYVPQTLLRCVLDWYHIYLNHPGGNRL